MADKLADSIESLEQRLKAIKNKKNKRDARNRAVTNRKKRNQDTRRKILVGAVVLDRVEQGVFDRATLWKWLDASLEKQDDRALFEDLDRLPGDPPPPA